MIKNYDTIIENNHDTINANSYATINYMNYVMNPFIMMDFFLTKRYTYLVQFTRNNKTKQKIASY